MDDKPRRRFRFRLRTLLIVVGVLSVPLGLFGYSLNWRRQRFAAWEQGAVSSMYRSPDVRVPWLLRPFGIKGSKYVWYFRGHGLTLEDAERLFPESEFVIYELSPNGYYEWRRRIDPSGNQP